MNFHRIKFLAIATEDKIEVYAWAPKPYHKFMAFKVSTLIVFQPFNEVLIKVFLIKLLQLRRLSSLCCLLNCCPNFSPEYSTKNHAVKLLPLNRSFLFRSIPSCYVCCVVIFACSLWSLDSPVFRVRSFKTKFARASFERDYNVRSPYFKLQGSR